MSESETDIAKDLWLRQNQPRDALGHVLDAIELDDLNAEAMHLAALLYLDLCRRSPNDCRLGEAERHATAAVHVKQDYREAQNTLGVVLIHREKYQAAVGVLKPLTADILYQTPENAWGNLGWAYLEQGELDPAIDALSRSVAAQPLFCVGNYRLGVAHERKRQPAQALAALDRALGTDDPRCQSLQEAYLARARVRATLGQVEDAADDLDRCVTLQKTSDAGKDCRSMMRKLK
jgi:Tfp pilus assembly protein PilF